MARACDGLSGLLLLRYGHNLSQLEIDGTVGVVEGGKWNGMAPGSPTKRRPDTASTVWYGTIKTERRGRESRSGRYRGHCALRKVDRRKTSPPPTERYPQRLVARRQFRGASVAHTNVVSRTDGAHLRLVVLWRRGGGCLRIFFCTPPSTQEPFAGFAAHGVILFGPRLERPAWMERKKWSRHEMRLSSDRSTTNAVSLVWAPKHKNT